MSRVTALALSILLLAPLGLEAAPIAVRLPEGNVRGFLILRSPEGTVIAHGELRQRSRGGGMLESRLTLQWKDGSSYDEMVTFSQDRVFVLHAYRLQERGPSLPTTDVSFDRQRRHYEARMQETPGGPEKTASGELECPPDLYNGMALVLLKNLPTGAAEVQMAAFLPKPRLITMRLAEEGQDGVLIGGLRKTAKRYLVTLHVGGVAGVVANLIGKTAPDLRYWFVPGEIPAFVRFQGAMFLHGPVWGIELASVEWPKAEQTR